MTATIGDKTLADIAQSFQDAYEAKLTALNTEIKDRDEQIARLETELHEANAMTDRLKSILSAQEQIIESYVNIFASTIE